MIEPDNIKYLYHKDGKTIVKNHIQALLENKGLIKNGWKHTATLNVHAWLEYILNETQNELLKEIKILKQ
jgi:hypothetical protein